MQFHRSRLPLFGFQCLTAVGYVGACTSELPVFNTNHAFCFVGDSLIIQNSTTTPEYNNAKSILPDTGRWLWIFHSVVQDICQKNVAVHTKHLAKIYFSPSATTLSGVAKRTEAAASLFLFSPFFFSQRRLDLFAVCRVPPWRRRRRNKKPSTSIFRSRLYITLLILNRNDVLYWNPFLQDWQSLVKILGILYSATTNS